MIGAPHAEVPYEISFPAPCRGWSHVALFSKLGPGIALARSDALATLSLCEGKISIYSVVSCSTRQARTDPHAMKLGQRRNDGALVAILA
jgi:hypothetical protein